MSTDSQRKRRWRLSAVTCAITLAGYSQAAQPGDPGRVGNVASWHTTEYDAQWGLAAIHADAAYAAGYSGLGEKVGILDTPVNRHPEFNGDGKLINVITEGVRAYTDPHRPGINAGDRFYFDGSFHFYNSRGLLENHGVHVAGIAAANRDGSGMHGVAFDSQVISVDNDNDGPGNGEILGLDGAVTSAGWRAIVASGARVVNNSWGVSIPNSYSRPGRDPNGDHFELAEAQAQYRVIQPLLGSLAGAGYQGAIDTARSGLLVIFSAGNEGNYNQPDVMGGMPWFVPDIAPSWLTVASMAQDPSSTNSIPYTASSFSSGCGYTASFCVSAPGTDIYSSVALGSDPAELVSDYGLKNGTSMAAPHVTGAAAVLMQRFPYMDPTQIADVLKTTTTDMGAPGIDPLYGWGMIDLGKAINGPGMFYTAEDIPSQYRISDPQGVAYGDGQFVANIPGVGAVIAEGTLHQRICDDIHCGLEVYSNDISGHGGLTKTGAGTLLLTGNDTYSGPTRVNQGLLAVNGSVASDVSIQQQGTLGGSGRIGSLTANRDGTVAPGNSIGTLSVDRDVRFESGSRYAVEIGQDGRSDRIASGGTAQINGGDVTVSHENGRNLLSQDEVRSLAGQRYDILSAANGVSGKFDSAVPQYLFLGTALRYRPDRVLLDVGRNDRTFESVAETGNQRGVARAAESLGAGHPVYESILASGSTGEARHAFRQLGGQVHADIASALINDSRYLRETLNGRLRQSEGLAGPSEIKSDEGGAWAQLLGAWDHASGTSNATGYQSNTYGVLLGLDSEVVNDWRLGVATGYSRTSLDGGHGAKGDSDNYHLAAYGGREFGNLAFRSGAAYTWHRIGTSRDIAWGAQRDRASSSYSARTAQLFAETGYAVKAEWVNLEPFANLAYVNFENNRIAEHGGAAALGGGKQHTDATLSTLGLRADTTWQVAKETAVSLRGEAGWQHQYGDRDRATGLHFRHSDASFVTNSVPVSRDGLVLKAGAEVAVNDNAALTLGYGGLLSSNHQDNSVNAGFNWRF